jgi:hypothetical protein
MGRKMICNQKTLGKFSKSEKNLFAENIIEWAEK